MPGAPRFWGPRALFLKKYENAESENAGPQKMRSEKARGRRKRGAPGNAEPVNAGAQKARGPRKRGRPQSGFIKKMELRKPHAHCLQLHYNIFGL